MLSGNRREIGGTVVDRIGAGEENPELENRFQLG
jgi:hypothetical protein